MDYEKFLASFYKKISDILPSLTMVGISISSSDIILRRWDFALSYSWSDGATTMKKS